MRIELGDLTHPKLQALLDEHLAGMHQLSPPESVHALGPAERSRPEITFWCAWEGAELLGCGALKELSPSYGEIKSMRTARAHLRRGVARALLGRIVEEARRRSYTRLSLETGSTAAFHPAQQLYSSFGFSYCEPFADYAADPNSVFMTRLL